MATVSGVNIGLGNGLLADSPKPLHEPMLTSLWHSPESTFHSAQATTILHNEFENFDFKVTATSPRANEFNSFGPSDAYMHR